VPVAATPGFGPHDEVLAEALLGVLEELVPELELDAPVLELLLLPHPASASAPRAATTTKLHRTRAACWNTYISSFDC
jgi:hypothetical protein